MSVARLLNFVNLLAMVASVFATFFRHGQVLETFRGKGIYQSAVDVAIGKLNHGSWVCDACECTSCLLTGGLGPPFW